MININSKTLSLQYFLGGKTKVNDLISSAKRFGGATQYDDAIYSNYETDELIKINNDVNSISIFVPSTINVNQPIDNRPYVTEVIKRLKAKYNYSNLKFYNTKGSWHDQDTDTVVIENITIVTMELSELTLEDINYCISIANYLKETMVQQAISININDSLCLV